MRARNRLIAHGVRRKLCETGVRTENSNSDVLMMQSTEDRVGVDTADSLNWTREGRVPIERWNRFLRLASANVHALFWIE
jgi:hypothetical protein